MSESDTRFNERDGRCTAVQLMLPTDRSYDNWTIASTLKMQRTVQHLRAQINASDDPLEVVEREPKADDTARKTRTKEFIEKVHATNRSTNQPPKIKQIQKKKKKKKKTIKISPWNMTRLFFLPVALFPKFITASCALSMGSRYLRLPPLERGNPPLKDALSMALNHIWNPCNMLGS